jgi:hypothetical protein
MKKLNLLWTGLFFLLLSVQSNGQSKTGVAYFAGKWSMVIKGTPDGDAKMIFILENKTDSLAGVVQDSTGTEISKISKIELTGSSATVYFTAQGYDVNVVMNKKDDDHVAGSLLGMFDTVGERIKSVK